MNEFEEKTGSSIKNTKLYAQCLNVSKTLLKKLKQEKERRIEAENIVLKIAKHGINMEVHTEAKEYQSKYMKDKWR